MECVGEPINMRLAQTAYAENAKIDGVGWGVGGYGEKESLVGEDVTREETKS